MPHNFKEVPRNVVRKGREVILKLQINKKKNHQIIRHNFSGKLNTMHILVLVFFIFQYLKSIHFM